MGLSVSERKALTNQTASRYRAATKKEKKVVLDQFCLSTGYNRKCALHLLNRWGKAEVKMIDGKAVRIVVGRPRKRKKRVGKVIYDKPVRRAVRQIWKFFDYLCGKRLVVLMRMNMEVLREQPEFDIDDVVAEKLTCISAATVEANTHTLEEETPDQG